MADLRSLSKREQDVANLVLEGKSNKLIASALNISLSTVEFHLKNIYARLGVASRVELVLKLRESTVAGSAPSADNRDTLHESGWVNTLKNAVSKIGKELTMENVRTGERGQESTPTFFESIRICLAKYAEFQGRASRAEFWWFFLFVVLVASALAALHEVIAEVFLIAVLLPLLAAGARRLRDSGQSVWWLFFLLVPVAGIITVGIMWAQPPVSPLVDEDHPA